MIYAFGAMLSFTIAHLAVIKLRFSEPDRERPWRGPGNIPFRGKSVPLFAVFGGLGTGLAWVVVTLLDVRVLISGVVWLAIGITSYVLYRRRLGLSPYGHHQGRGPAADREEEVEYQSVLVAFEDGPLLGDRGAHGRRGSRRAGGAASTWWPRSPCPRARRSTRPSPTRSAGPRR